MRKLTLAVAAALAIPGVAFANYTVKMNAIDEKGVGASVGTVSISAAKGGGVTLKPKLHGLPPGTHGFHVHEAANCGAKEQDGKMTPGGLAGGHLDPEKSGKHEGPEGRGHQGDLPPLVVGKDGKATKAVSSKRLTLEELAGKALVLHEGGDNFSDQPKPLGGGGKRIACGVIAAGAKKR
jgi:Cu-Zn family superoxide dismutase